MGFLIVVLLVVALTIWLIPVSRGAARRADSLEQAIAQLLDYEVAGAFLTVRPNYSKFKFIQYSRYEQNSGTPGIELAFPSADWSEEFFPKVVSAASSRGLSYKIEDTVDSGLRFAIVRFGHSTSAAAEFGQHVLNNIFGFKEDYHFRVRIN